MSVRRVLKEIEGEIEPLYSSSGTEERRIHLWTLKKQLYGYLEKSIDRRINNLTQNDDELYKIVWDEKFNRSRPPSIGDFVKVFEDNVWIKFPFYRTNYGWSVCFGEIFKNTDGSIHIACNCKDKFPFIDGKIIDIDSLNSSTDKSIYQKFEQIAYYLFKNYKLDDFLNIYKEESDRLANDVWPEFKYL